MKKRHIIAFAAALALGLCAFVLMLFPPSGEKDGAPALKEVMSNYDDTVAAIRKGLREHSKKLTVTFAYDRDILDELTAMSEIWMEEAMAETDAPDEGDYIRYQYGGYSIDTSYERTSEGYNYRVEITPRYYTYMYQEQIVTERLEEVFAGFGFDEGTPDIEKIETIYDYVCANVKYDKVHKNNPHQTLRSSAYAALVYRTATCQGYCTLLYRMLRQAGIEARIITGAGELEGLRENHAWNIVRLDGRYYNLDATWDAGAEEYAFFLKGSGDFEGHIPDAAFLSKAFLERYPMADREYVR